IEISPGKKSVSLGDPFHPAMKGAPVNIAHPDSPLSSIQEREPMKPRLQRIAVFGVLFLFALSGRAHARDNSPLTASTQLVIVTTADWGSVSGQAQLFEKHGPHDHWRRVGDPFEVVVGGTGLAWGAGVLPTSAHDVRAATDPVKKEGDGK